MADGLTGWLENYAVSFEAHSAKNGRCVCAHGKCWGVRRSSQSGGLAEMALGDEMPWTPNTTNLQPRAPGLASVWEQVSAASGIQTCFKLCVVLFSKSRRLSRLATGAAALAGSIGPSFRELVYALCSITHVELTGGLIPRIVENESEGGGLFSKQSISPGASCWDVGWTWRQPVRP